jgi:hypothetical protein
VQSRREEYAAEMAANAGRFKFLDEAGSSIAMTRAYGRAAPGARIYEGAPQNYGENITMLACLSSSGLSAPMTVEGADGRSSFSHLCRTNFSTDAFCGRCRGDG